MNSMLLGSTAIAALLCTTSSEAPHRQPPTGAGGLVQGNHAFTSDLFARLRTGNGNLTFSPLSIQMAFGLAQAGANGETEAEIAKVLHLADTGQKTAIAFGELMKRMTAENKAYNFETRKNDAKAYVLEFANAIWNDKTVPLEGSYVAAVRDHFQAHAAPLDFRNHPDAARKTINHWVSQQTRGKIDELLKPGTVSNDTIGMLTNALYFNARWDKEFSKRATKPREFHAADGAVERPFMHATRYFRHLQLDDAQALTIGFERRKTAMTIVLPNGRNGLAALEKKVSGPWLDSLLDRLRKADRPRVALALPKFSIGLEGNITEHLRALGLKNTLSSHADFSAISKNPLYVNQVIHAATIDVDERGVEAAAATAMALRAGAAARPAEPIPFVADHPFLFVLHEVETGAILFFGRCAQP